MKFNGVCIKQWTNIDLKNFKDVEKIQKSPKAAKLYEDHIFIQNKSNFQRIRVQKVRIGVFKLLNS